MNPDRLTGKRFNYFRKLKMPNTYFKETEIDIEELQINQNKTYNLTSTKLNIGLRQITSNTMANLGKRRNLKQPKQTSNQVLE